MRSVGIGDEPEVGVEGLGRLIVERVEEVDTVLVDLVREVAEQSLVDQELHLPLGNLETSIGRIRQQGEYKYKVGR